MPHSFSNNSIDTSKQPAYGLDSLTKYVRVRSPEGARFVEFDFAIADPELFVELIMPKPVFDAFCKKHQVKYMTTEQMAAVDAEMEKWRYGEQTLMSHNHQHSPTE